MGFFSIANHLMLQEHRYRPITGKVLMIGRQNTALTGTNVTEMLRDYGIPQRTTDYEIDASTVHKVASAPPAPFITDRAFFRAFADCEVMAIDVSDYEGAEIVHDLTVPIPKSLRGQFDFIYDGSTLDNVFDPPTAIRNLDGLLRPGGRMVLMNWTNSRPNAYTMLSPDWFMDFFALNEYEDAKCYVVEIDNPATSIWQYDPYVVAPSGHEGYQISSITSHGLRATVCLAVKGARDAVPANPVQKQYRRDHAVYIASAKRWHHSPRPPLNLNRMGVKSARPNISNRDAMHLIADADRALRA